MAQKPDTVISLSNGFPSGEHFNLNIISKDPATFTCPGPTYDELGNQVYGNVIYIPEYAEPNILSGSVKILIESGLKGPKGFTGTTELQVTDWCAGFGTDDIAMIRLPKNEDGYRVYARVLGKPTKDPENPLKITVYQPEYSYVTDENGVELLQLGLVTPDSTVQTPVEFIRYTGKSKATNITPLFLYTGTVTHLSILPPSDGATPAYCCTADANGVYTCVAYDALTCGGVPFYISSTTEYTDAWMFNIADFVGALWGMDPSGAKLLNVRFYKEQNVTIIN